MEKYIIIALSVVIVIMLCVIIAMAVKIKGLKFGGIKIKDGVRYTKDEKITSGGEVNITFNQKDTMLEVGKTYTIGKGKMLPGTYAVLATTDDGFKFNIRLGGVVREYSHGDKIVLNDGDEITALSHSVILR